MARNNTEHSPLRTVASVIFAVIWVAALLYWLASLRSIDMEAARRTLQTLVTAEAALVGFTVAGLAFAMNMTFTQAQGLETLKMTFLKELASHRRTLDDLVSVYQSKFQATRSLPEEFKYQEMSHLTDRELLLYLRPLVLLANREGGEHIGPQDPAISELESDAVKFFRIACGALLSPFCSTEDASNDVVLLSAKLRKMDLRYNVVRTVNNVFDIRRAARRGLPLFSMMLVASWVWSISVLSGLSGQSVDMWAYGLAVLPAFVLAGALAYYIDQMLSRYIQ